MNILSKITNTVTSVFKKSEVTNTIGLSKNTTIIQHPNGKKIEVDEKNNFVRFVRT